MFILSPFYASNVSNALAYVTNLRIHGYHLIAPSGVYVYGSRPGLELQVFITSLHILHCRYPCPSTCL